MKNTFSAVGVFPATHKRAIAAVSVVALLLAMAATWQNTQSREVSATTLEDLLVQTANAASVDYFLKIEGVDGESNDEQHKNEIEILSYSWGVSQTSPVGGGGAGAGKVKFNDFNFQKSVDKSSPTLMLSTATGKHYPKATLTVRKSGGDRGGEYIVITLTDVMVTSYQNSGSQGSPPSDSFSLNFTKIEYSYTPTNPDGSAGEPVKAGYDLALGKKV